MRVVLKMLHMLGYGLCLILATLILFPFIKICWETGSLYVRDNRLVATGLYCTALALSLAMVIVWDIACKYLRRVWRTSATA